MLKTILMAASAFLALTGALVPLAVREMSAEAPTATAELSELRARYQGRDPERLAYDVQAGRKWEESFRHAPLPTPPGPCINFTVDCDLFPGGNGTVILELYRKAPPWPLTEQPIAWTAYAVCPPSSLTWCPGVSPPYWLRWESWDGARLVDTGRKYYP